MNSTNNTTTDIPIFSTTSLASKLDDELDQSGLEAFLLSLDFILAFVNLSGNTLTIVALNLSKKLSALLSNQFIFNLALSDILVGLSILYHDLFYIGVGYEKIKYLCILKFVFIFFACSSSIYNLFGIAADRYLAVVYPLHYSKYMTKKVALLINCTGWITALSLAMTILWWNNYDEAHQDCKLVNVVPEAYTTYVTTPMFVMIWMVMLVLYAKIWNEARVHTKRLKNAMGCIRGTVPDDSKSIQLICFILGCFSICWLPYFIYIMVVRIYGPVYSNQVYEIAFTMAMANSCMNPIIYAWKNKNFRTAFWCLLHCKSPNSVHKRNFVTNHVPNIKRLSVCNVASNFSFDDHDAEMSCSERKGSDANFSVQTTNSSLHY
ncbi:5-hydroxytryptamine receptor 1A [Agrilus planipennis]|uniref:5-hydroxytryptamine receptor 1A n=1 Tax=Agrilus planipennis TaxID=224129 RepID=A0A1W4WMV9_AGRPL|nr:5-hydroxytryptamine receptor 1A [Agrilus planipennis]